MFFLSCLRLAIRRQLPENLVHKIVAARDQRLDRKRVAGA
jgi:hypothetical protein